MFLKPFHFPISHPSFTTLPILCPVHCEGRAYFIVQFIRQYLLLGYSASEALKGKRILVTSVLSRWHEHQWFSRYHNGVHNTHPLPQSCHLPIQTPIPIPPIGYKIAYVKNRLETHLKSRSERRKPAYIRN